MQPFSTGERSIGYALSGGGSRGAAQAGALRALTEAGIHPGAVAGTSAGAVNAAWYALFPHRVDRLEAIWLALRTQDVFPGSRLQMLLNFTRRGYIHHADRWEQFLRTNLGDAQLEEATIPCSVVAVRLSDGAKVVFNSGPVVPALMASTAIPGVFPPYTIDGELYVDGGVVEYLPVTTLIDQGLREIVAVDCSWFSREISQTGPIVDRVARIAARSSVDRVAHAARAAGTTVHLLRPELPEFQDGRDFRKTAELIECGYRNAAEYVADSRLDVSGDLTAGVR